MRIAHSPTESRPRVPRHRAGQLEASEHRQAVPQLRQRDIVVAVAQRLFRCTAAARTRQRRHADHSTVRGRFDHDVRRLSGDSPEEGRVVAVGCVVVGRCCADDGMN